MHIIKKDFISQIKYHLGCLDIKEDDLSILSEEYIRDKTIDILMKLKNYNEAFLVAFHYKWAVKHLDKIKKIFLTDGWAENKDDFSSIDVKVEESLNKDTFFATNLFSLSVKVMYVDENLKIKEYQKEKNDKKELRLKRIKVQENIYCYFDKDYLNSLGKKQEIDLEKNIATSLMITLLLNKGKYILYTVFNNKAMQATYLANDVKKFLYDEIIKEVMDNTMVYLPPIISSAMLTNTIRKF